MAAIDGKRRGYVMKIVLFVTGLQLGGAETQVADLARGFLAQGHEVVMISLTGECAVRLPDSPRFSLIELRANKTPWSLAAALAQFASHIRRLRPDVVHAHMVHANLLARVARLFVSMPVLVTSAHSRNEGGRARMLAYRLTDRLTDLTTNVSDDAVAAFVAQGAAPASRIVSMPNGIDTQRYRPDAANRAALRASLPASLAPSADGHGAVPIVLAAGRLVDAKDYPTLLDAFANVHREMPDARLFVAGDGPLRAALQARVDALNLAQTVTLLGRRDDVADWMRAADVYAMSSAWEGLPLVIGEAMASALPVVSTDCGGVRELLGAHDGNALVPVGNAQALGDAILQTLRLRQHTPDALNAIGATNRERIVTHYSLDAVVARWLDCYAQLAVRTASTY
ncbi:N-acetyl-alpha-D-glucosaminyl L-malate synthase [Pandoraea pneumonica]|uniref:N-acetyl-alpha-D-glucosaminyl L-malate synthase n=1 Tax=Pandoraea pneumonica TaxID=2508299 RepID=A0A5E4X6R8_9BURK|nr:glycosyltransferase [Pandoraea pneumonica]VVE32034.1 N-acetyl-alpha-D-glucosaminyl L-malate synthase [Pandoraea pneumonica]